MPIRTTLLFALLFSGCASMPMTIEEFQKSSRESTDGVFIARHELSLPQTSFKEVEARMKKYAAKCLFLDITIETRTAAMIELGHPQPTKGSYRPKIIEKPAEATLVLQRECTQNCPADLSKVPPGGYWVMIAEVFQDKDGKVGGYVTGPKVAYGKIVDDTIEWIEKGKGLCSEMP